MLMGFFKEICFGFCGEVVGDCGGVYVSGVVWREMYGFDKVFMCFIYSLIWYVSIGV